MLRPLILVAFHISYPLEELSKDDSRAPAPPDKANAASGSGCFRNESAIWSLPQINVNRMQRYCSECGVHTGLSEQGSHWYKKATAMSVCQTGCSQLDPQKVLSVPCCYFKKFLFNRCSALSAVCLRGFVLTVCHPPHPAAGPLKSSIFKCHPS